MESETAGVGLDVEVEEPGVEHADPPYFLVWGILFVLTMAEVGYAFLPLPQFWLAFGLIVMAVWKAVLVALYYMHLRFEPRRLWVLVTAPLPLAVILVIAVMTEF
ncbi:MAG: cytochrome C oxidase subunit IV family protein [Gemmatimonadota bacterium]